ncbi:hypothetical protein WME76_40485 [Sorangium sp. So ce119]|uniref:hypothetical protein n=1 Tax=Sorangium sp. So ce119 TaxID=3133279 RepID=UPI003F64425E
MSCSALLGQPSTRDYFELATCPRCKVQHVSFLPGWIPSSDQEFASCYAANVPELMAHFGHSLDAAVQLARDYYLKFTDETFCASTGVPTQREEFFWHEGRGLAPRMHYTLFLKEDPDAGKFIEWRKGLRAGAGRDERVAAGTHDEATTTEAGPG